MGLFGKIQEWARKSWDEEEKKGFNPDLVRSGEAVGTSVEKAIDDSLGMLDVVQRKDMANDVFSMYMKENGQEITEKEYDVFQMKLKSIQNQAVWNKKMQEDFKFVMVNDGSGSSFWEKEVAGWGNVCAMFFDGNKKIDLQDELYERVFWENLFVEIVSGLKSDTLGLKEGQKSVLLQRLMEILNS